MLSINKKSPMLYYLQILYDQKLSLKVQKYSINRFYYFKKSFIKLYTKSYTGIDLYMQIDL